MSRAGLRLAAVVVAVVGTIAMVVVHRKADPWHDLIAAANTLDSRRIEGRLAQSFDYRPLGEARGAATAIQTLRDTAREWYGQGRPDGSVNAGRLASSALLMTGQEKQAFSVLGGLLRRGTDEPDLQVVIQKSTDAGLLTDFSAAALQQSADAQNLLLAYEAADRAWQLAHAPAAAWNRAIAADRIGMRAFAARAWREVVAKEPSSSWAHEAEMRRRAAVQRATAAPDVSLELFFYRQLIIRAMAGETLTDVLSGDHLASDAAESLRSLPKADRQRLNAALTAYIRGRDSFERNEYEDARRAYAIAEAELGSLHVPLVLIARDQRIRSECSQGKRGCVEAMRAFRRDVSASGRYPWLAARSAYGEGQVLYRKGHIYEATEHLQRALNEFEKFGDETSAGFMHVLLANVFAAGGESDLALRHFLNGLACRTPAILDRRRKMLEDAIMFMLRHGYLATAELLLDDLAASSTTDASNVNEAMLRGVVAFRRGDRRAASLYFARGHALLHAVRDDASRSDVEFRLAIAEAGSRMVSPNPIIGELDAAIAAYEGTEYSVWLPQLLTERGAAWERTNELARAESDYRRAIDILESREPRIDETVLALGIVAANESPFDRAIRLLLRQGRIAGALSIAQRSTALRISSLHARGAGVRDAFRQSRAGGDGVADMQSVLQSGQVAVAHHLLRDELVTWIVTKGAIRAIRRPLRMKELVQSADRLSGCAARRSCNDEAAVESLSDALLRAWIDTIPRGATLLIQPPAELEAVPFSMLKTRAGERLIMRDSLATAPSLRAFARASLVDGMRAGSVSAFFAAAPAPGGNLDPLPLAVGEVNRASRLYARALAEIHATRATFLNRSPSFPIVHFAGHVVVNAARPLFSALVFENGEMLYVHELDERSFANARLIVLSACDTGRSPRPTMSVANALLSQNVPSVVYTLWPVSDDAAEEFAIAFHRAIVTGKTRADAVRDAQLSLMLRRPNETGAWAAFALAGTPGSLVEAEKGEKI